MPPNTLLFDIANRSSFVCRSCRISLGRQAPKSWLFQRSYARDSRRRALPGVETTNHPVLDVEPNESLPKGAKMPVIRFFNADAKGNIHQLKDEGEFQQAMMDPQLKEIDERLRETSEMVKTIEGSDARTALNRLMQNYGFLGEGEELHTRVPDLPKIRNSVSRTRVQQRKVAELNNVLRLVTRKLSAGTLDAKLISDVWKRYWAARFGLKACWDDVPPEVWQCLWTVLSSDADGNSSRMSHVYALAKDMTEAGITLTETQQLQSIEGMFVDGLQKAAIENWKKSVATLGSHPETTVDYWELGVRMCSLSGDIERAERAADTLFNSSQEANPRCLLHLVRALLTKDGNNQKAWQTYERMRELLGTSIRIEDYDELVACFLEAGQTETAFHVFVNMMFSDTVDLHGKTRLPSRVTNRFFFGKWLKRLIGAGDLAGTRKVLEFMQQKGVMGASVQANGFIGALLRSGTAENLQVADELAWSMIEARRAFVGQRRGDKILAAPTAEGDGAQLQTNKQFSLAPKATLETYSLMAESYKDRGLHHRMEELWVAFKEAEIATDAFMTNQLLEAYVQKGNAQGARELYFAMVDGQHIVPDAYTFLTLYKSLSINRMYWVVLTDELKAEDAHLCRRIFRDMVRFNTAVIDKEETDVLQGLGRHVLHSFRKVEDYVGLVVALRVLCDNFGFTPTEAIAIEMMADSPDALRDGPSPRMRRRTLQAIQALENILASRVKQAEAEGRAAERLSPAEKAVELADAIEMFFRRKIPATGGDIQRMYQTATRDMGSEWLPSVTGKEAKSLEQPEAV